MLNVILPANAVQSGLPGRIVDVRTHDHPPLTKPGYRLDPTGANTQLPPVQGLLPDETALTDQMIKAGLLQPGESLSDLPWLIFVDDDGGPVACRWVWALAVYGVNASMVDGGYQAAGCLTEPVTGIMCQPSLPELTCSALIERQEMLDRLDDLSVRIVDARSPAEFNGDDRRSDRGGHIPNAINLDWTQTQENRRFIAESQLKQILQQADITPDHEIWLYCQSHQRSSVWWVLLRALGYPCIRGYAGAWSDWGNCMDTPIKTDTL